MATKRFEFDVAKQMATAKAQDTLKTGAAAGDVIEAAFTTPADMSGKDTRGMSWNDGAWLSFSKNAGNATLTTTFNGKTTGPHMDEASFRLRDLKPSTQYVATCTVDADVPADALWVRLNVPVPYKTNTPRIPRG